MEAEARAWWGVSRVGRGSTVGSRLQRAIWRSRFSMKSETRPVMIYRLVAEQTVEERILALQQRKRELAEAALGGADRAAGLTREDLLELLA